MHNSYLAEASRDLPKDATEAAAIQGNMAQAYAILSLAQKAAYATAAKVAGH